MTFFRYFLRRLILTIPLLLGITFMAFLIANAIPADPINANLPPNALNDEDTIAAFRKKWGLDKPLHEQYLVYLGNLLQGDMGTSIKTRKPVLRRYRPALARYYRAGDSRYHLWHGAGRRTRSDFCHLERQLG